MSIGKRVSDAIDKMDAGDREGALFQICAAIEATAKAEFSKPGRGSYKDFIHQHLGMITELAFGNVRILNINLKYNHPDLRTDANGCASVQDILYHVVRCGLYHNGEIPYDLRFTDEPQFRVEDGTLTLPSGLIFGLIAAVVVSPANVSQHAPKEGILNLRGASIPVNKLWGRRAELLWLLDATNEAYRLATKPQAT